MGSDAVRSAGILLEQLPYCLDSAHYSILQIVKMQQALAETLKGVPASNSSNLNLKLLEPSERDPIAFMVDGFLDSARRAQNALIPYLSRALSLSLPNSLNELMKKLDKGATTLPPSIEKELKSYWGGHGKKLKAYRDLAQHHALVSSEGYVLMSPDGTPCVYLVLPNNPEEKGIASLKYNDPVIHAFLYILNEFTKLLAITYRVTDLILPSEINRNQSPATLFPRNTFKLGEPISGQAIRDEKAVQEKIAQCLERQAAWSAAQPSDQRPPLKPEYITVFDM